MNKYTFGVVFALAASFSFTTVAFGMDEEEKNRLEESLQELEVVVPADTEKLGIPEFTEEGKMRKIRFFAEKEVPFIAGFAGFGNLAVRPVAKRTISEDSWDDFKFGGVTALVEVPLAFLEANQTVSFCAKDMPVHAGCAAFEGNSFAYLKHRDVDEMLKAVCLGSPDFCKPILMTLRVERAKQRRAATQTTPRKLNTAW